MNRLMAVAITLVVAGHVSELNAQQPIPSQDVLVQMLVDGNANERSAAVSHIRTMDISEIPAETRAALIKALGNEAELHERNRSGQIAQLESPELIAPLARLVAQLRDPSSISPLAGALGVSPAAMHALSDFGDPGAKAVLAVLSRSDDTSVITDGLVTLRFIIEMGLPLSRATALEIRETAMQFLTARQQSVTRLWRAIDLAAALNDEDLRQVLEGLASDSSVLLRGVEPQLVERTQARVADRLAGVPPRPYHTPGALR